MLSKHLHLKFLNFEKDQKYISLRTLAPYFDDLRLEHAKQKLNTSYKKSLSKALTKIQLFQDITAGTNWQIYKADADPHWMPIGQFLNEERLAQQETNQKRNFEIVFNESKEVT